MLKRISGRLLGGIAVIIAALWLWNTSLFSAPPKGTRPQLIAHRGVAQTYHREGLTTETCTAERIDPPTHGFLENTLPSMKAAFDAGAAVVEIDVHLTADGRFAVFHDWTVDCRTNGTGATHDLTMDYLKTLDLGHGYTADGGQTYPFRGRYTGMIPALEEVFEAFPDGHFLINFKSNDPAEGEALNEFFVQHPEWLDNAWGVYGGNLPTRAVMEGSGLPGLTRPIAKECLVGYAAMGWTGSVPEVCRGTIVFVPVNAAHWLWGWPHKFTARMNDAGAVVVILGEYSKDDPGTTGIDTPELLARIPARFDGYIWTNKIEEIAALLAE